MQEESTLSVKLPLPEVKSVPNIVSPDSERAELVFEEHLIEYVRAEKEHLSKFVKDCRKLFDHILNQVIIITKSMMPDLFLVYLLFTM